MSERYKNLTSPLMIRNKFIKSRLVYPVAQPHFLQGPELYPDDPVVSFLTKRAQNGAAIILMQDLTNLDQRKMGGGVGDGCHFGMYDIEDPGCQNMFTQLAEYIHYYGSYIVPEINLDHRLPICLNDPKEREPMYFGHPACEKPEDMFTKDGKIVEMSLPRPKPKFPDEEGISGGPGHFRSDSKMLVPETMEQYINATVEHALTYKSLNFDGCFLDLSYNFTIGKFLVPWYNMRKDEFGGSFENRIRFPMMCLKRLREALGNEFMIATHLPMLSIEEKPGYWDIREAAEFLKLAEPYLDLVMVRIMQPDHAKDWPCESAILTRKLKELGVKIPLMINTYYKDLDSLEKIVKDGDADMLAPGHLFICNEHIDEILRDGNGEDLNPCIECHACRGTSGTGDWMSHCTINPEIGMEHRAFRMAKPVVQKKKVAVIGGGPGGMKCALYLKERGHEPVIFEKSGSLGGQIKCARYSQFKWELLRYLDFLCNQMIRKEIQVRLNVEATPEMIRSEGFDAVVVAAGATAKLPDIEGVENVKWNVINIYGNEDRIGKRVVVVGGASSAAEAAIHLQETGHEVTLLSRKNCVAYELNPIRSTPYYNIKLNKVGVEMIGCAKTTRFTADSVIYLDNDGAEHIVECDDILASGGMTPEVETCMSFVGSAKEYFTIGDCRQAGNMRHAIRDAYAVAMQI